MVGWWENGDLWHRSSLGRGTSIHLLRFLRYGRWIHSHGRCRMVGVSLVSFFEFDLNNEF
jgi:hypothetical protein